MNACADIPAAVRRPLLRYLGGKWRLGPWIVGHFPKHRVYVEPFGGSAAVLLQKERAHIEIYNDIDEDLLNLFRILRGPDAQQLIHQVGLTLYSRAEYLLAHEESEDPIERARRLIVRSHMGHGNNSTHVDRPKGFRRDGSLAQTRVAGEWGEFPEALSAIVERIRGVSIESEPASDLIAYHDDPKVLIYLDPPYLPDGRSKKARRNDGYHTYRHEMTEADHVALLEQIVSSKAMIILSGYPSPLYDEMLPGWQTRNKGARTYRNGPSTETIWLNKATVVALEHGPLFAL